MGFKDLVKSLSIDKTYDKVIVDSGVIDSAGIFLRHKPFMVQFIHIQA